MMSYVQASARMVLGLLAGTVLVWVAGCGSGETDEKTSPTLTLAGLPAEANRLIKERSLAPDDVTAALATYMPTGKLDDYVMFASGGHSGRSSRSVCRRCGCSGRSRSSRPSRGRGTASG